MVGGTQAGDTHSVLSCKRKGQQPRYGWLWGAATPVVDGAPYASKRDANTPMTTNHRKAILHFRLSWHKSQADFQEKWTTGTDRTWQRPWADSNAKKRKLRPTDRESGSEQTTHPGTRTRTALTTEENVTISSSRITRQGHCRYGAGRVVLGGKKPSTNKKGGVLKEPLGDTRIVAQWNLRANVTDGENEWRTAQWRTCKAGRALAQNWRQRKKRQECSSAQSTSENYLFLALVHGVAVNKFQQIPFSKRKKIDERKLDAVARRCLDGTDVLSKDEKLQPSEDPPRLASSPRLPEASLLIWSRQRCRSEETQFPIATPATCGPPHKVGGTVRPGQGSHNTGVTECLLLGNRTGISLGLLRRHREGPKWTQGRPTVGASMVAAIVTENETFGKSSAPKAFSDEGTHNFKPILQSSDMLLSL